jgi:carboxylesterase type B
MATWVQQSKGNIVAVNIQYRLGLLGFLASSVVMADGTANAGLLDQKAAIAWVTRYALCSHKRRLPALTT